MDANITRKIKWIIRNVKKDKIVKFDTSHRIVSPEFQINVTDSINDTWFLQSYVKNYCYGVYLYKYSSEHDENYSVKSTFSTKDVFMDPLEQSSEEYDSGGYGYPELVNIEEMFQEDNPLVDTDNCFIIDVEIAIKDIQKDVEIKPETCSLIGERTTTLMSIIHGEVESDDATLTEVLKHINNSSGDDDIDLILKVLNAARKFEMTQLENECTDALSNMINTDNALDMLKTAQNLNLPKLEDKVLPFILKNYHTLKTTKKWQKLTIPLRGKIFDAFSGNISSLVLETVL